MRERMYAARLDELPADGLLYVNLDGLPLALAHVDGQIYALSDSCCHEGGPLSEGVLRGEVVTCPWHGWSFNVRSGKSVIPPIGLRLATYAVHVDDGAIYVDVDWPDA